MERTFEKVIDGRHYNVHVAPFYNDKRGTHSFVSVSNDFDKTPKGIALYAMIDAHAQALGQGRHTIRGAYPTVDKAWDAFNDALLNSYRQDIRSVLKDVVGDAEVKFNFSRKAGCACGCSPGFKLRGFPRHNIWINARRA